MKTVIFLSQRGYDRYNFEKIYDPQEFRFIAILDSSYFSIFPEQAKKYFEKIYEIPKNLSVNFLEQFSLNYKAVARIAEKEMVHAGGSQNIRLSCIDEFNLLIAGKLSDEFQIPGPSYQDYLIYRDKTLMKEKLKNSTVRIPKFIKFDAASAKKNAQAYFQQLVAVLGTPLVLKPIDGASGMATEIINDAHTFTQHLQNYAEIAFEAEEFISGKLYHCDALIQKNKIILAIPSEYLYPNLEFQKGKIFASIPLKVADPLGKKIVNFTIQTLKSLGMIDGCVHMEMFLTSRNELVFLEAAARPAGGLIIPNYQKVFGINFYDENLKIQMGEPALLPPIHVKHYSFGALIPRYQGKVIQLNEPKLSSRYEIEWKIKPGDIIEKSSLNLLEISGGLYVYNSNYEILYNDFNKLRDFLAVETKKLKPS